MSYDQSSNLLRKALQADGIVSGAVGTVMALAAQPLSSLLGLPEELMRWAGIVLLPFALFVLWLSARNPIPRTLVWAVVTANALWVAESVLLLMGAAIKPTALGCVYVIAQAAIVLLLAELEYFGLRKARAATV